MHDAVAKYTDNDWYANVCLELEPIRSRGIQTSAIFVFTGENQVLIATSEDTRILNRVMSVLPLADLR